MRHCAPIEAPTLLVEVIVDVPPVTGEGLLGAVGGSLWSRQGEEPAGGACSVMAVYSSEW